MEGAWILTNIECQILLDIHIALLILMRKSLLMLMLSCFSQHQLLKNTFMESLLCMVVKIIAFELPMKNPKKNDQERLRQTLKKGSCSWEILLLMQTNLNTLMMTLFLILLNCFWVVRRWKGTLNLWGAVRSLWRLYFGILEIGDVEKTGVCPVLSTLTRSTTRRTNQLSFQIMFQRTTICFCRCSKIWERTLCWCVKQPL